MVQLTRIYTKSGDKGKSALGNGERLSKSHLRFHTIGTVDETNASIGLVRLYTQGPSDDALGRIQNDLFDVGADLCLPDPMENALRIELFHVERLEREIDAMNADLSPLNSFILPGGSPASSFLHLARTVCRRAERLFFSLLSESPSLNPLIGRYLNRLSDHLFVMARHLNDQGKQDILWIPGKNRSHDLS